MVQYYRDTRPRRSHVLPPLEKSDSDPNDREIIWNNKLEVAFRYINYMVSEETLLNFIDWNIMFTIHIYASDKHLGAVISQNDKPITIFLIK